MALKLKDLIALISAVGIIVSSAWTVISNQRAINVEIKYIKEKLQKIETSVLKTDGGIDKLVEYLADKDK